MPLNLSNVVFIRKERTIEGTFAGHPYMHLGRFCWCITEECFENIRSTLIVLGDWDVLIPHPDARVYSDNYRFINRYITGIDLIKYPPLAKVADEIYNAHLREERYRRFRAKIPWNNDIYKEVNAIPEVARAKAECDKFCWTERPEELMSFLKAHADFKEEDINNITKSRVQRQMPFITISDEEENRLSVKEYIYKILPTHEFLVDKYDLIPVELY